MKEEGIPEIPASQHTTETTHSEQCIAPPGRAASPAEGISEDNFRCSVCLELMVDPTTLTCGHTMCRCCVAAWWHNAHKSTCPECNQIWQGFPQVNFTLRNTIHSLFPEESTRRQHSINSDPQHTSMIQLFNQNAKGNNNNNNNNNDTNRNWSILFLLVALTIGVAVFVSHGVKKLMGSPHSEMMSKPVSDWSPDDVSIWVEGISLWSQAYAPRFLEAGVDGALLLKISDTDLQSPPINMAMEAQRKVFLESLANITLRLSQNPSGLWQYKERKSGMAIFLMLGIREFPRTTLAYLYMFDYHDTFRPIFDGTLTLRMRHLRTQHQHTHDSTHTHIHKRISIGEWWEFLPRWLLVPYYLVARFAAHYLDVNYWTSRIVIMHAILMTLAEFTKVRGVFSTLVLRKIPLYMLKHMLYVCGLSLFIKVVWPFVPFFIADCAFYWCLYVSPFDALNKLRKRFMHVRVNMRVVAE